MSLLDQLKNKFAARSASQDLDPAQAPAAAASTDADHEVDRLLEQIDQRLEQSARAMRRRPCRRTEMTRRCPSSRRMSPPLARNPRACP
jgi:hypothetical protein